MTHIIERGYELVQSVQDEDTDMDQSCFDFMRDLPPPTFADMVIRGDPEAGTLHVYKRRNDTQASTPHEQM